MMIQLELQLSCDCVLPPSRLIWTVHLLCLPVITWHHTVAWSPSPSSSRFAYWKWSEVWQCGYDGCVACLFVNAGAVTSCLVLISRLTVVLLPLPLTLQRRCVCGGGGRVMSEWGGKCSLHVQDKMPFVCSLVILCMYSSTCFVTRHKRIAYNDGGELHSRKLCGGPRLEYTGEMVHHREPSLSKLIY